MLPALPADDSTCVRRAVPTAEDGVHCGAYVEDKGWHCGSCCSLSTLCVLGTKPRLLGLLANAFTADCSYC